MASSLSLSSPQLSLTRNWKHHVFPSFHGEDVRKAFLSHLLKEFRSKAIDLFIDNNIERSKSIGPELIEAIRGSRIAIVLLSKKYASSTWCLDELVEIIKCREKFGQTVIALFYEVDPTDVKKQTGEFGEAFRETCVGKTDEDIQRWKQALWEVATVAGYHSRNWDNEAEMIQTIVLDVSDKLNCSVASSDFEGLVGMESHLTKMGPFLRLDSEEVKIIGIWGPSGIGKTTIARFLFNQHSQNFQMSVFMDNIKRRYARPACSDDYDVKLDLQEQFMSKIINQESFKISHLGTVRDRLKDKKVLVVLDDVDHLRQLQAMANQTSWFGPWSRIIITTQDRKLLQAAEVNHIHKVEFPSSDEALQMFCTYAFGQKFPKDGFAELAWEVTKLVGKLPLGLRVMGSYFRGMAAQDWTNALSSIKTQLDGEMESILKFSYDALREEDKEIFLYIACFFNLEEVNILKACLHNSFSGVKQGLDVLVEKSLVSLDGFGSIEMHNLLVQLGREIVRKQFVREPGKRLFLNDARDMLEVFKDDKSDNISIIGLDLDGKENDIIWTSMRAFERWSSLQFLRIDGLYLVSPRSLPSISQKLRLLSWIPWSPRRNSICPKLRVLNWRKFPMSYLPSNFNPKFLVKLVMVESRLKRLWKGNQPLTNLIWMDLSESRRLKELPDLSTATNLLKLNLKYCSSLVKLPSSIGNASNLQELHLSSCGRLVKLPSSIGNLVNIQKLDLSECSYLVELPSSIGKLVNLKKINLRDCSSLVKLPSSIGNLVNLKKLILRECSNLVELPSSTRNLHRLSILDLGNCSKIEVCLTSINFESLHILDLQGCSSLKCHHETSRDIEDLKPSGTAIEEVSYSETQERGPWIGRISRLYILYLRGMKKLVSLPQLPYSVLELDAEDCESLERLDCSFRNPDIRLNFANCFKLNQEARDLIIHTPTSEYAVLPGGEVPACFPYRAYGSSLIVKLNQSPLLTSSKFKACIIFSLKDIDKNAYGNYAYVKCSITSTQNALTASISPRKELYSIYPEHLYTFNVEAEEVDSTELLFEFQFGYHDFCSRQKTLEIKECGIMQFMEVTCC